MAYFSASRNTRQQQVFSPPRASFKNKILTGPLSCRLVVLFAVLEVPLCNVGHQGVVRVRVGEEGRDREENLDDREGGRPLVLELCVCGRSVGVSMRFHLFAGTT